MAKIKAATEENYRAMPRPLMFCKYVRVQGDKILDLSHETFLPKGTA
jgi:hypothetical protein